MIRIASLADHTETIPTLSRWFRDQWPEYYDERTLGDIAQDFYLEANRVGLPVRLVAFANDRLAGTIVLRDQAIWTLPECRPGLGGLLVVKRHRGRGIGTRLIEAGMKVAQEQGYKRVYATTVTAAGILERLGWKKVQAVSHEDEHLRLFCYEFDADGPIPHAAESASKGG